MTKRILSTMLALVLLATAFASLALAEDNSPAEGEGYYYVYTANGKTLNVRESPGGKQVGSLKYGTRIHVDAFIDENWALILYKYNKPGFGTAEYAAYVNRRFLTKKKPPARNSGTTAGTTTTVDADALTVLNNEYRSAKIVTPYNVIVRPTRVSGWAAMHWGPSTDTEILGTYRQNSKLKVLSETNNWLQVEDTDRGMVGFIKKNLVAE